MSRSGERAGASLCPYCGGKTRFSFARYGREYRECIRCGLNYCTMSVSEEEMFRDYAHRFDREWRGEGREAVFAEAIGLLGAPAGKLLDIGCGGGKLMQMAATQGWDVHGVEPGLGDDGWVHAGLRERIVPSLAEAARDAPYDAASLINVIDQIPEPWRMLDEVAGLLRDGGRLAIRLPNFALHMWLHRLAARLPERWCRRLLTPLMVFRFGMRAPVLAAMLRQRGFIDIRYHLSSPSRGDTYGREQQRCLRRGLAWASAVLYRLSLGHVLVAPSLFVTAIRAERR